MVIAQVEQTKPVFENYVRKGDVLHVMLPGGLVMLADAEDEPLIRAHRWYRRPSCRTTYAEAIYRRGQEFRRIGLAHRLILSAPDGADVDHINRNGLDNRRSNLRICSRSENRMNSIGKVDFRKSKYKGIWQYRCANTYWAAQLKAGHDRYRVSGCLSEAEAAAFYDLMAKKFHGEFALLNFPNGIPGDVDLGPNPESRVVKRQKGRRWSRMPRRQNSTNTERA